MPLVNRTTNLKSLRYGSDRRDQGSSNQPYVTTPIPDGKGPGLGDVDFLLRGGSLLPASVVNDVSRLTQMMFDFKSPNGLLFTVKQNALSRSSVNQMAVANNSSVINLGKNTNRLPLNNGIYLPTSTLAQAAANPLGGHLLKQGINPFASTNDIANGNSLSTGFGGLLPLAQPIYLNTRAQNERQKSNEPGTSRLIQFLDKGIIVFPTPNVDPGPPEYEYRLTSGFDSLNPEPPIKGSSIPDLIKESVKDINLLVN